MIQLIETHSQLDDIFQQFKTKSKIGTNPDTFLVGLDCEYIPTKMHDVDYKWIKQIDDVAICTIQLANSDMCLVINMCKLGPEMPQCLVDLLLSNSWIKTGVSIDLDMKYLSTNFQIGHCSGHIDLKNFGVLAGMENPSLKEMYEGLGFGILNKNIADKKIYKWYEDISVNQLKYAANDAIASYKIGNFIVTQIVTNIKQKMQISDKKVEDKQEGVINISTKDENYVGILQEYAQKYNLSMPEYGDWQTRDGLCNTKVHDCKCTFVCKGNIFIGYGAASTKKDAKMQAAKEILSKMKM